MHITGICKIPDTTNLVTFASSAGQAWGRWQGTPPTDSSCFVEVDIPDPVSAWEPAQGIDALTGTAEEVLDVCAVVDSVDHDGIVALRLASDIILVEWEAVERPSPGERIQFSTSRVELYPYQL
ncbi:hypothetical protein [Streptomyces sp. NPDC057718]|uniref:hypothetical protein n=1 Tax=Streptomyces sp. NPDC057718 TaxID=3346225 RepID=UPI00368AFE08